MIHLPQATVVRRKDITPELMLLWLQPEIEFTFKAGQYCTIGLPGEDGKLIERPYSIVSSPHEKYLELFIELIHPPQGVLTPLLWTLRQGDTVSFRPRAKGVFTFEKAFPNQIMVATVTGIAPYISMLREAVEKGQTAGYNFYVLQGASYHDEFVYDRELFDMMIKEAGKIRVEYVPTVSRPWRKNDPEEKREKALKNIFWRGETGRVNEILKPRLDEWELNAHDSIIYVCGHPGMIEDVKNRFALPGSEGVAPQRWRVKEERFWK